MSKEGARHSRQAQWCRPSSWTRSQWNCASRRYTLRYRRWQVQRGAPAPAVPARARRPQPSGPAPSHPSPGWWRRRSYTGSECRSADGHGSAKVIITSYVLFIPRLSPSSQLFPGYMLNISLWNTGSIEIFKVRMRHFLSFSVILSLFFLIRLNRYCRPISGAGFCLRS